MKAFKIVPLGDFFESLIDGIIYFLKIDFGDYVE
jgi:hypothetical protein